MYVQIKRILGNDKDHNFIVSNTEAKCKW